MKRYDPIHRFDQGGSAYGEMREEPDGDYVKYDETTALLAKVREALEGIERNSMHSTFTCANTEHSDPECPRCIAHAVLAKLPPIKP